MVMFCGCGINFIFYEYLLVTVDWALHFIKICLFQDDHKFKQALKVRNPKHRLRRILDASKNKQQCESSVDMDVKGQESEEPVKKRQGGCGAQVPKLTIEGMKMIAEYKSTKKKNEDQESLPEPAERKQQLSAERVSILQILLAYLFLVSFSSLYTYIHA